MDGKGVRGEDAIPDVFISDQSCGLGTVDLRCDADSAIEHENRSAPSPREISSPDIDTRSSLG